MPKKLSMEAWSEKEEVVGHRLGMMGRMLTGTNTCHPCETDSFFTYEYDVRVFSSKSLRAKIAVLGWQCFVFVEMVSTERQQTHETFGVQHLDRRALPACRRVLVIPAHLVSYMVHPTSEAQQKLACEKAHSTSLNFSICPW